MNLSMHTYRFQSLLSEAKSILIFIKKQPDKDTIAAACSLYLSLSQRNKQVTLSCPDKMTVEFSDLFAVDKITDELGKKGKNLVISFPYVEGSVEKVSYHIESSRFNLVIEPRGDNLVFDQGNVEFTKAGEGAENFDLIILLGVTTSQDLGKFQTSWEKQLSEKNTIIINNAETNLGYGTLQIISPTNASVSEIVALLLSRTNFAFDKDIAGNLLKGIKEKTNNFTQNTTADSFEAASVCLRKSSENKATAFPTQPYNQPKPQFEAKKTPPDWLKPKIFRSSSFNPSDNGGRGTIL